MPSSSDLRVFGQTPEGIRPPFMKVLYFTILWEAKWEVAGYPHVSDFGLEFIRPLKMAGYTQIRAGYPHGRAGYPHQWLDTLKWGYSAPPAGYPHPLYLMVLLRFCDRGLRFSMRPDTLRGWPDTLRGRIPSPSGRIPSGMYYSSTCFILKAPATKTFKYSLCHMCSSYAHGIARWRATCDFETECVLLIPSKAGISTTFNVWI